MPHKQKPQQEEESGEGAPLWIISFADMISLLMAFFVMLTTFSGFGPAETAKLKKVGKAVLSPNFYGGWYKFHPKGAIGPQALAAGQLEKGSEKPTLEENKGSGLMAETEPGDFRTHKIILVKSKKIFWATGTTLSKDGRDFLGTMALFAGKIPERIVVSENGPGDDPQLGLLRAVSAVKYLNSKGIPKDRCSIGMKGMMLDKNSDTERMFEIALLDEKAYK
jgi:hypothetical protein